MAITPWKAVCALAARRRRVAGAVVFITASEAALSEELRLSHEAGGLLARPVRGGAPLLVSVAGASLREALASMAVPAAAVQIVVVSPAAPDRAAAVAEIKAAWPEFMAAFDADAAGAAGDYIFIDFRPRVRSASVDAAHAAHAGG